MNERIRSKKDSDASETVETEVPADQMMDHEYDGIREYDNPMPGWWKALFWVSVLFSVGYVFWYHVAERGTSVAKEFADDVASANAVAAARAMRETVSEASLMQLTADASMMQSAAGVFGQKCGPCHADRGQGNIGPNLTDRYWIHGQGTLMDIHHTVSNGVLAKGMPAWSKQLTPVELKQLVAYVGTLRGSNVPGKAPEGVEVH